MNIATQTAPPPAAGSTDLPGIPNRSTGGVEDGLALDAAAGPGFGTLLAKQLRPDGADDLPTAGPDLDALSVTLGVDGRPILVATSDAASVALDAAGTVDPAKATGRAAGAAVRDGDGRTADDGSQAGSDLAAQLAIVSQWAAIAKPSAPDAAPSKDGPDIQRKLETIRTIAKTAPDAGSGRAKSDADAAAAMPSVFGGAVPAERPLRAIGASGFASTKAIEAKVGDATSTTDDAPVSRAFESIGAAILGTFDGTADGRTAAGAAGSFVTQVAAQGSGERVAGSVPAAPATVHETVGTPAWSHEVAQATLRMAANDLQTASLQLNPAHLGPLDIQLRIDQGVAHIAFGAAHAETRQALESSRATLDQLFGDQGLKLGDCSVNDSSSSARGFATAGSEDGATRRDGHGRAASGETIDRDGPASTVALSVRALPGLVDTFA